jgi:hypothetical protein
MEMPNFSESFSNAAQASIQWLNEQEWFQPVKAKWEELDPQSRTYLQLSGVAAGGLFFAYLLLSSVWGVHSLKSELNYKSEMLSQIQSANDELKQLRSMNSSLASVLGASGEASADSGPWAPYLEGIAAQSGIGKDGFTLSESKPGATSELSKEVLYDITVKKINVHQMVRFAYALESGSRPVKLRNLVVNTQPDMSGYLDATLSISAFTLLNAAGK